MASEAPDYPSQRIAALKAKLKARDGKPNFKENCEAIKAEIARLEARQ